jgi:hypothetical protein
MFISWNSLFYRIQIRAIKRRRATSGRASIASGISMSFPSEPSYTNSWIPVSCGTIARGCERRFASPWLRLANLTGSRIASNRERLTPRAPRCILGMLKIWRGDLGELLHVKNC